MNATSGKAPKQQRHSPLWLDIVCNLLAFAGLVAIFLFGGTAILSRQPEAAEPTVELPGETPQEEEEAEPTEDLTVPDEAFLVPPLPEAPPEALTTDAAAADDDAADEAADEAPNAEESADSTAGNNHTPDSLHVPAEIL